jgi:hypothetical protein
MTMNFKAQVRSQKLNRRRGGLLAIALLTATLTTFCQAQPTNTPARSDYSSFKIITDRNIFNPNRRAIGLRPVNYQRSVRVESFSLVGMISYTKGAFAFFDGTSSNLKKVLEPSEKIAGFTVTKITPQAVQLEADGKQIEMPVGTQMRREDGGKWELAAQSEAPAAAAASTLSSAGSVPSASSGEANDVLKKLMQQREQELK